jgi:glutathione reductase (NADPH)
MDSYDVVIVGAGTAGQTAAYELSAEGLSVAVVEKSDRPGGICALAGCQAKKWFYEVTETMARSRHLLGKGIAAAPEADWSAILEQKNRFTAKVPEGTVKGFGKAGIDFLKGAAKFLDDRTLVVDSREIRPRFCVLATGAAPMRLPIQGAEHIVTSDDFLDLKTLPGRILFVGGGFISFEFAHFAARLGPPERQIVILEAAERPLGPFDAEMVDLLVEASAVEGIGLLTGVKIQSVSPKGAGFVVATAADGAFEVDLVVNGAGRAPQLDGLALEAAGISHSRQGIAVDAGMQTANPKVFAVGDCAATIQLARVADYEAHVAARNILAALGRGAAATIDYGAVPALLFTYPQCGMLGQTEAALKEAGTPYRKSFGKHLGWPTYTRIGMGHAAYKILVGQDRKILGAHILSDNAAGLLNTLGFAMRHGIAADALYWQNIMSPYPSRESDLIYMLKPFLD